MREIASEGLWPAEVDGSVAGALVVDETPSAYAPPSGECELYVHWLLVARGYGGRNVGGRLLDHARAQARARGIGLVRVDCWSGGDGALVRYYERQGFTPTVRVSAQGRELQVFEDRVRPEGAG